MALIFREHAGKKALEHREHGRTVKKSRPALQSGILVRLTGIEPTHPAPEAGALSTELQAQTL